MSDDRGQLSLPRSANNIRIVSRTEEGVNLPVLRRIARAASGGQAPSDAHLLLRDSRAARRRHQFRRAAIDAGSALEVALADFNNHVTHVIFPRPPTLGTYVNNPVIARHANLPGNLQTDLVNVRNAAIHQNAIPTWEQVGAAIGLVASVLNRLAPLPI